MSAGAGLVAGELAFQATPIILTRGIATALGGYLPIIALTEGASFTVNLLSGSSPTSLASLFASFVVIPGGTLASNEVPMYPMANQAVAANAIIAGPLACSVLMHVPAKGAYGMAVKLATMTALQKTIQQHSLSGGTYTIVTPAYPFTDCLLARLTDVTGEDSTQQQVSWQWDFVQPLVSKAAAKSALNGLMGKLAAGQPLSGAPSWSGAGLAVGNPSQLALPSLVPQ